MRRVSGEAFPRGRLSTRSPRRGECRNGERKSPRALTSAVTAKSCLRVTTEGCCRRLALRTPA
jgi:hypothetical protein